eukprot:Pgem_evm1s6224
MKFQILCSLALTTASWSMSIEQHEMTRERRMLGGFMNLIEAGIKYGDDVAAQAVKHSDTTGKSAVQVTLPPPITPTRWMTTVTETTENGIIKRTKKFSLAKVKDGPQRQQVPPQQVLQPQVQRQQVPQQQVPQQQVRRLPAPPRIHQVTNPKPRIQDGTQADGTPIYRELTQAEAEKWLKPADLQRFGYTNPKPVNPQAEATVSQAQRSQEESKRLVADVKKAQEAGKQAPKKQEPSWRTKPGPKDPKERERLIKERIERESKKTEADAKRENLPYDYYDPYWVERRAHFRFDLDDLKSQVLDDKQKIHMAKKQEEHKALTKNNQEKSKAMEDKAMKDKATGIKKPDQAPDGSKPSALNDFVKQRQEMEDRIIGKRVPEKAPNGRTRPKTFSPPIMEMKFDDLGRQVPSERFYENVVNYEKDIMAFQKDLIPGTIVSQRDAYGRTVQRIYDNMGQLHAKGTLVMEN